MRCTVGLLHGDDEDAVVKIAVVKIAVVQLSGGVAKSVGRFAARLRKRRGED